MKKVSVISLLIIVSAGSLYLSGCTKSDDASSAAINNRSTAQFNSSVTYGTVSDSDGNIYKTVTIGTQTWMAENLRTTTFNDTTDISKIVSADTWAAMYSAAYCNYNNTLDKDSIATFGRLYNFYAVATEKLAPEGWRVATDEDWQILVDYLGGTESAGAGLKELGLTHWSSPNTGATNSSGFTALPAGTRTSSGTFEGSGTSGYWWSSEEYNSYFGWRRAITSGSISILNGNLNKKYGFSVRCVKSV